jgi:hypothetical protein
MGVSRQKRRRGSRKVGRSQKIIGCAAEVRDNCRKPVDWGSDGLSAMTLQCDPFAIEWTTNFSQTHSWSKLIDGSMYLSDDEQR